MRHAAIAGGLSAAVTLMLVLAQLAGTQVIEKVPTDFSSLLDVALIVGLSYAIYRASRVAALALFLYFLDFLGSRIYVWTLVGSLQGWPIALIIGYFCLQGNRGTFLYHALPNPPALPSRPMIAVFAAVTVLLTLDGFSVSIYLSIAAASENRIVDATESDIVYYGYLNGGPDSFQLQVVNFVGNEWQTLQMLNVARLDCDVAVDARFENHLVTVQLPNGRVAPTRLVLNPEESALGEAAQTCAVTLAESAAN